MTREELIDSLKQEADDELKKNHCRLSKKANIQIQEDNVKEYLKENLPTYKLIDIRKKSECKEDYYLYSVIGYNKASHTYALWRTWNAKTQCLNGGVYNIQSYKDIEKELKA